MSNDQNGWIKVHRKIIEKGYYKRSQYVHLWIHILLKASHDESEFMWNGKIEKLLPGQFITGREKLSQETGISQTTIERILKTLESEHQIGQQKTNRFRLLTVINWLQYQKTGQQNGHPADIQRTSSGHPADTFKNEKNFKNEKKKEIDVLSDRILEVLKINLSDKKQTEALIKLHGLDLMLSAIDRMKKYFDAVSENKWTVFVIGKYWRNLYEKLEYFISDENLQQKLKSMAESNKQKKPDCRTVSTDFSSDEEYMKQRREKEKMKELTENATKGSTVEDVTNV